MSRHEEPALQTIPVIVLIVVALVQAALILALLLQRTRHARVERAVRESEAFFRHLADDAPLIMWTTTPEATLNYLNKFSVTFTGMPLSELMGDGWLNAVHPDDLERCLQTYVPAIEARQPFLMEYRVRRADGVYRWILDSGVPKYEPDGSYSGHIGCSVDITERKAAEDALLASQREIHHLAGRLLEAQDAERARIARDLHDDASQQIAHLAFMLGAMKPKVIDLPGSDSLKGDLLVVEERAMALANSIRRVSHGLHPAVLEHTGLVRTLTSQCANIQRSHEIATSCSAEGEFDALSREATLCLYRIAQEAVRNVIVHAAATKIDIQLRHTGESAEITIADDGRGFNVPGSRASKGLGLVSIAERAKLAGGSVSIESELRKGTRVTARIPMKPATAGLAQIAAT